MTNDHDEPRAPVEAVPEGNDASDLSPNEQAVLSQQTAPNRTPPSQVEAARGKGSVGAGAHPKPPDKAAGQALDDATSTRRGASSEQTGE